jgi:hypothetical protein
MKYDIPIEYLRSRFSYEKETGILIWKDGQCAGKEVGCITENKAGNKYRTLSIGFSGKTYNFMAHQMIWAITHGDWADEIDHKNGDGLDNRLCNLRSVCRSINNKNHKRQSNNTSGISGVSWIGRINRFRAYGMNGDRKQINLGCHRTLFDAACARKSWELGLEFTERHGK